MKKSGFLLKIVVTVCLFALFTVGISMASSVPRVAEDYKQDSVYNNIAGTVKNKMDELVPFNSKDDLRQSLDEKPLRILLVVEDQQQSSELTDELAAVLKIDSKGEKIELDYIPEYTGLTHDKAGSIETFEDRLNMNLDYYIQVKAGILADTVDAVGGITIENDGERAGSKQLDVAGEMHLNGAQTMSYINPAVQVPREAGNQLQRQIQVVNALMEKLTTIRSIDAAVDMLDLMNKNVNTNMSLQVMMQILKSYAQVGEDLEIIPVSGQ
ncbi:LCP family protein [Virgibacillus sp. DJP39]|uniref:LCP family glycopolymer transferase n=1 Tax=Virgibacillus sp. DJP39 TaxID=3409790 RepID=UPI003BB566EA